MWGLTWSSTCQRPRLQPCDASKRDQSNMANTGVCCSKGPPRVCSCKRTLYATGLTTGISHHQQHGHGGQLVLWLLRDVGRLYPHLGPFTVSCQRKNACCTLCLSAFSLHPPVMPTPPCWSMPGSWHASNVLRLHTQLFKPATLCQTEHICSCAHPHFSARFTRTAPYMCRPPGCAPDAIKLFVGNIPKSCTESQLLPFFETIGKVVDLVVVRDRVTRESKVSRLGVEREVWAVGVLGVGCQVWGACRSPHSAPALCLSSCCLPGMCTRACLPANPARSCPAPATQPTTLVPTTSNAQPTCLPCAPPSCRVTAQGSAFVWYATRAHAEQAILQLNMRYILPGVCGV